MTERIVYLRNGQKCRVLGETGDRLFVAAQVMYSDGMGEPYEEDGHILELTLGSWYVVPPTEVLSKEVAELNQRIHTLQVTVLDLENAVRQAEHEHHEKMARYAELSTVLEGLDDFIGGEITHYFILHYTPLILSVAATISSDQWHKNKGRLLSLEVSGRGELFWGLNQYHDGSGLTRECRPCTSYQEALEQGQAWIDARVLTGEYELRVIDFAHKYKLSISADYIDAFISQERCKVTTQAEKRKQELSLARIVQEAKWEALRHATK